MIMARNEDGTYSQVGFVKDNVGIDTGYIYDKDGDIVFEKGFTRETSGTVPLTINGIGKDLKAWSITGNTVQNGTPTPENPVEVKAVGDRTGNLFDGLLIGGLFTSADFNTSGNKDVYKSIKVFLPAGTYTFSFDKNVSIVRLIIDGNYSQPGHTDASSYTITSTTDGYVGISFRDKTSSSTVWDVTIHIMLNSGSTALPYEPYGYKIPVVASADGTEPITTPIYLLTPLYSGEVLRSDGSREVKLDKLVLTGEEAITTHKTFEDGTITICIPSLKAKSKGIIYCTHLQNVSFVELYNNEKQGIAAHSTNDLNNLYCLINGFTKLTQYKDFFRNEYATGTPVTVWYQLAEPTTETFTAPQIPTLNGTTVIDVDTAVKPTEMYIKYKSSK